MRTTTPAANVIRRGERWEGVEDKGEDENEENEEEEEAKSNRRRS